MKQMFVFDPNEAANIIAQGIATTYGIAVEKVEYSIKDGRLVEIRAWKEREEIGTKKEGR